MVLVLAMCIAVDADRIRTSDLAKAAPAFAAAADTEIGFAPGPGTRRILSVRELASLAARLGVAYAPEAAVCFERLTEPLTRERVVAALRAAGAPEPIELADFSRFAVPRGELAFTAASGSTWRGSVRYGGGRSVPVWARVRVRNDIERGEPVTVAAVRGNARVSLVARAEAGGRIGDTIPLRREDNQHTLRARITGPGRAIVDADIAARAARGGGAGR